MRSPEDIEKLIVETRIKPRSQMRNKVLPDALRTQEELYARNKAGVSVGTWRKIMNSRITKYVAAAVIVIAVFVGIKLTGGSIDVTTVAWSQVVEQISNHTKYKCRQRIIREQGPQIPARLVYHLNLSQRRQEHEDGIIGIIDMRGEDAITVELDPAQKKATVKKLIGFGPREDPHIVQMVKRFEQESSERLGTKKLNGKILHGFRHQPNKYSDFTIWVDQKTKLPVEIEIKHLNRGQTIFMDQFEFDFELDPSAFSTDVPDGYEVKTIISDYRRVEPRQVTAEEIRSGLNHPAYTAKKLPWMEKLIMMQVVDPLMKRGKVYVIGILSDDGNNIIINQSNVHGNYREAMMGWILKEQLVMEAPGGAKLHTHPNGSEYARLYLKSFAEANAEFFDMKNLSDERFTRMIVMPDETVMALSANKQMSEKKLEELVESLIEIKAN
jgi:hypothetical protein